MIFDWFVNLHIALMGIIEAGRKYEKFEKYLFMILVSCDVTITISFFMAFARAQSGVHKIILLSGMPMVVCFLHRLVVRGKRRLFLSIMKKFRFDASYFTENRIKINTKLTMKEDFYLIFIIGIFTVPLIGGFPYVNCLLTQNRNYNNPDFYIVPYLFHFWNVDSFLEYVALSIFQNIGVAFFIQTLWSFLVFIIYVLYNINTHIRELNEQLNNLIDLNTIPIAMNENGKPFEWIDVTEITTSRYRLLQEKLIVIIRHQQFIQRYITDFISYINFIISVYVISFIAISFFFVLGMSELEVDAFRFLHITLSFCLSIFGLFTWCYVGQAVNNLDDNLQQSLYLTRWYMLPVKLRKLLVIAMVLSHQERKLTTFGIYKINFEFYAQILKILYSLVNLVSLKAR